MRLAPFIIVTCNVTFPTSDAGTHAHYDSHLREYHPTRIRFQVLQLLDPKHSANFLRIVKVGVRVALHLLARYNVQCNTEQNMT